MPRYTSSRGAVPEGQKWRNIKKESRKSQEATSVVERA
jgi:hypothetical protein